MTPERQAKLKALRQRLANLSPEDLQAFARKGILVTVEGRPLSLHNSILLHLQSERVPTVVGGYQQWRKAGKQVRKGEHGMSIWFPIGPRSTDSEDVVAEKFFIATVFDISQTEPIQ